MRHHTLARATFAIAAVFTVAAIVFATTRNPAPVERPPPAEPGLSTVAGNGAALFQARCARCHDASSFAAWARAQPEAEQRGRWFAEVLASHFPPPAGEREAIIAHIQQAIAGQQP